MKIPKIKFVKYIFSSNSNIAGITLWPFIFLLEKFNSHYRTPILINHETIHIKQQQEMLVLPFYIWYVLEYIIKFFKYGKQAYYNLSFEREAYTHEKDMEYLKNRKPYSWLKYIWI